MKKLLIVVLSLGLPIALFGGIIGGIILARSFGQSPEIQFPIWKFGQYLMFVGIINSLIYTTALIAAIRMIRQANRAANKPEISSPITP